MSGTNDYRDAKKIFDQYNQSIEAYNIYLQREPTDVSDRFQSQLNDAGEKIYICFETAIKHVLEKYYKSKANKGEITEAKYRREKRNIERKKRPDLIRDLQTCNPPKLSNQTVNYTVINNNASAVVNKKSMS